MNNIENNSNVEPELGKRKRIKTTQPIAAVKPSIEDKIKRLDEQGFDYDRIAAMLLCQKSLVKQVLG